MPHTREKTLQTAVAALNQQIEDLLANTGGAEYWPRYMSLDTCAQYLDKAESTIRNWNKEGVLPVVDLSTLEDRKKLPVFIDRFALDALFAPRGEGC